MKCIVCTKPLPRIKTSLDKTRTCVSKYNAHCICLMKSDVFIDTPSSAVRIASLCNGLGIDSFRVVTRWISLCNRLETLGLNQIPISKWKFLNNQDKSSKNHNLSKDSSLLTKRDDKHLVSNRELCFNLDLFD